MKILSIVGARPQFIKEAMIQHEIRKQNDIKEVVVHTGQHYDINMSDVFFEVLNMSKPDYQLGIKGSSHGEMTGKMIIELEKIITLEKPDLVLLHGDTNSTLAGAIVASKLKIKIAHVEAGLRQEPKDIPEEINRVITDRVSDYLFAPTEIAFSNLEQEGLVNNAYFTGDVMYDIYLKMKPKFNYSLNEELNLENNKYIVMTLHRDFNVDTKDILKAILTEVNRISKEILVVFPIHPRTKKRVLEFGLADQLNYIKTIDPVDYLQLMGLTQNAYKIITDSGGYQKEAYFAKKKACVIMNDTSWRELVLCGHNKLVNAQNLYDSIMDISEDNYISNIYGEGNAAQKIIEILKS